VYLPEVSVTAGGVGSVLLSVFHSTLRYSQPHNDITLASFEVHVLLSGLGSNRSSVVAEVHVENTIIRFRTIFH
jgi:hypothetical protein